MAIIEGIGGSLLVGLGTFRKAGIPAAADFNGVADTGALCIDTTNKKLYINTGTLAAGVWTVVGSQV